MLKTKITKKNVIKGKREYNPNRLNIPDLKCTECNDLIPLGDLLIQTDFEFEDPKDNYIGYFCSEECHKKHFLEKHEIEVD